MSELKAKLQSLTAKHKQRDELLGDLEKSLELQKLWPEVFEHGGAKSHWYGLNTPYNHAIRQPTHKYHMFVVTDGSGESRTFSFNEVPKILGGGRE